MAAVTITKAGVTIINAGVTIIIADAATAKAVMQCTYPGMQCR
jgi:hypothetical protein